MPIGEGLVPEFYCTDFARSLNFYVEKLGFNIVYQRPEDKFAYLEREGTRVMLEQLGSSRDWLSGELDYPFGRGVNFQIATRNILKLHASLQQSGHKFFLQLEDKWYRKDDTYLGNRQFMIQDPDGYLLRFAENLGVRSAQEVENTKE
jgi:catechol 2,3-dioxygenase-like lactoylglutathione lyase family enzyme